MNFGDLQSEVFLRIEESESSPDYWALSEVKQALNEGWEDLARRTKWFKSSVMFALQDEVTYYSLLDHCPEEPICVDAIWDLSTERWFNHTSVKDLEVSSYYRWEAIGGSSINYFIRGALQLGVHPYPILSDSAHNSDMIKVYYTGIPFPLGPDDYSIPFRELELPLITYALYDLKGQEGEDTFALQLWAEYIEEANKVRSWVRGHYTRGIERRHRALDE